MQPVEQFGRKLTRILIRWLEGAEVVRREHQAFDAEAGIGVSGLDEALEEQAGHDQYQQREAALQGHQAIANRAAACGVRSAAQGSLRIDAAELERGCS